MTKRLSRLSLARYKNLLKEKERELEIIYKVAQSVNSLDVDKLLGQIVNIVTEVTKCDSCLIYVLNGQKDELVLRASKNPHPRLLKKIKLKVGEGITGWVARKKKVVVISQGAKKDRRFKYFRSLPEDKFEAFLSVPIVNREKVYGVINVQHKKKHKHQESEVKLIELIGKLVSSAVVNAILIEKSLEFKEALRMRKAVERAKGILMEKRGISEKDAYRILQKESMDSRKSLREVSEAIILAEKIKLR